MPDLSTPEITAREVLDVIPLVMRAVRAEFRSHRQADLSVPQFRALLFIQRSPGAALNALAEHLGRGASSTSTLIEGLVRRGLVERQQSNADRRCLTLRLTENGSKGLRQAHQATLDAFSARLAHLSAAERLEILRGLNTLRQAFSTLAANENK